MKVNYSFGFIDEPQFRAITSRAEMANKLRAARAQPKRYKLTKIHNGYQVQVCNSSAIGTYERC